MISYKSHFWKAGISEICYDPGDDPVEYINIKHCFTQCCGAGPQYGSLIQPIIDELDEASKLFMKEGRPYADLSLEEFLVKMGFGKLYKD